MNTDSNRTMLICHLLSVHIRNFDRRSVEQNQDSVDENLVSKLGHVPFWRRWKITHIVLVSKKKKECGYDWSVRNKNHVLEDPEEPRIHDTRIQYSISEGDNGLEQIQVYKQLLGYNIGPKDLWLTGTP